MIGRDGVANDAHGGVSPGVVDIHIAVVRKRRIEGKSEQALLGAGRCVLAEIEKRRGQQLAVGICHPHSPCALEHEKTFAAIRCARDKRRLLESFDDRCQCQVLPLKPVGLTSRACARHNRTCEHDTGYRHDDDSENYQAHPRHVRRG